MFSAISAILIVLFFIVMAILVNPHITGAARLRPRRRADDEEIGVSLDQNRMDNTMHYDRID